jgi:hypothetical protein
MKEPQALRFELRGNVGARTRTRTFPICCPLPSQPTHLHTKARPRRSTYAHRPERWIDMQEAKCGNVTSHPKREREHGLSWLPRRFATTTRTEELISSTQPKAGIPRQSRKTWQSKYAMMLNSRSASKRAFRGLHLHGAQGGASYVSKTPHGGPSARRAEVRRAPGPQCVVLSHVGGTSRAPPEAPGRPDLKRLSVAYDRQERLLRPTTAVSAPPHVRLGRWAILILAISPV